MKLCRLDSAQLPSVALVFLDLSLHGKAFGLFAFAFRCFNFDGLGIRKVDSDEEVLSALKEPVFGVL